MDIAIELQDKMKRESSGEIAETFRAAMIELLTELVDSSEDIVGAQVTTGDGRAWAQVIPEELDKRRLAAMSSALLALGDTFVREAKKGATNNVLIEAEEGNIYVLYAGKKLTLTVFTGVKPNLGLTLALARRTADQIVTKAREAAATSGF